MQLHSDNAFFETVMKVVIWALSAVCRSWEVIIRWKMGERYLSWLDLQSSLVVAVVYFNFRPSRGFAVFLVIFVLCGLWRRFEIWRRKRNRIKWHSRSIGESIILKPFLRGTGEIHAKLPFLKTALDLDRTTFLRVVEPLLGLLIGTTINRFDQNLGLWLIVASICLGVKNQLLYAAEYNRLLDADDAALEAQFMQAAQSGAPLGEVAGIQVIARKAKVAHYSGD